MRWWEVGSKSRKGHEVWRRTTVGLREPAVPATVVSFHNLKVHLSKLLDSSPVAVA
jgi:hypothetical protein